MLHRLTDAEICQLEDSFVVDEYVLRFDVSVNDFVGVEVLHSFNELDEPIHYELLLQQFVILLVLFDVHRQISVCIRKGLH